MKIIVSRFNEDIKWVKQFQNVIIYNKGNPLNDNSFNEIVLKNVGREGHTYYKYIYDNYDNLDDYTVFLQGNPFDHSPHLIYNLNKFINNKNKRDFVFLSERILECSIFGGHCHGPMKETFEHLFGNHTGNEKFIFGAGAQFIVSKKNILSRPKSFYLQIINLLNYDIHPMEGFCIERFHNKIFTDI